MTQLLVGIFPSADVASLEVALSSAGVDRSRFSVIVADARTPTHEDSFLHFEHVLSEAGGKFSADIDHGTGLLTDFGGTDVPGVTDSEEQSLTDFEEPESVPDYLKSLPIPSDEAQNYDEAITEGRSVVVYRVSSDDELAQAEQSLRAAGLRNVRTFPLNR
ncbi:MAG: hypothetical protein ACXVAM_11390 [Vulcanimicrobiaceae bacterium]